MFYNSVDTKVDLYGDVLFIDPTMRIASNSFAYNSKSDQGGTEHPSEYRLASPLARGTAERIELLANDRSNYYQATYSTCPPGINDWHITASKIDMNRTDGVAFTYNTFLNVLGKPVAYLPVFSFPLDDKRKSGFLRPKLNIDGLNSSIESPYYFNLAPNYDFTLYPELGLDGLVKVGGNLRYIDEITQEAGVNFEVKIDEPTAAGFRGLLTSNLELDFNDELTSSTRLEFLTDDEYLATESSKFLASNKSQLERKILTNYKNKNITGSFLIHSFENIGDNEKSYSVLPQIALSHYKNLIETSAFDIGFTNSLEATSFYKNTDSPEGLRLHLAPSITFNTRNTWFSTKEEVTLNLTNYYLSNHSTNTIQRSLPSFNSETKFFLEREVNLFGNQYFQTLEPQVNYSFTPYKNQNQIPIFDSTLSTVNADSIRQAVSFNGIDRIGNSNKITLSINSKVMSALNGMEVIDSSIGYAYNLDDEKVDLDSPIDRSRSILFGSLTVQPSHNLKLSADSAFRLNPSKLANSSLRINFSKEDNLANLLVRDDGSNTYIDLNGVFNPTTDTEAFGAVLYDYDNSHTSSYLFGLQYSSCCWKTRIFTGKAPELGFNPDSQMLGVEFELKGLGSSGNALDVLLGNRIEGYRREDD